MLIATRERQRETQSVYRLKIHFPFFSCQAPSSEYYRIIHSTSFRRNLGIHNWFCHPVVHQQPKANIKAKCSIAANIRSQRHGSRQQHCHTTPATSLPYFLVLLPSILQLEGKSDQLAYLMKAQPSEEKPHVFRFDQSECCSLGLPPLRCTKNKQLLSTHPAAAGDTTLQASIGCEQSR